MVARRGIMVHYERDNGTLGEGQWYTRRGAMVTRRGTMVL